MKNINNLAIVIPTKDRHELLKRSIKYYNDIKFEGTLYIVDGSRDDIAKENEKFINDCDISIFYYKNNNCIHEVERISLINNKIKEEYVISCGDDDYIILSGVSKCIEFLDSNSDYDMCSGIRVGFIKENDKFKIVSMFLGNDWPYNNPIERFIYYMLSGSSTTNYVHRRDLWLKIFDRCNEIKCRYLGTESNICSLSVILSNIKRTNNITILQENSGLTFPDPRCNTGINMPSIVQLITSSAFESSLNVLRELISNTLSIIANIKMNEAINIFNTFFSYRLALMMMVHTNMKYGDIIKKYNDRFLYNLNIHKNNIFFYRDDIDFIQKNVEEANIIDFINELSKNIK